MDFVMGVRKIRGEMNIAPSKLLPVLLNNTSTTDLRRLDNNRLLLEKLTRLESITIISAAETIPQSAMSLIGEMQILIPMAGLIDKQPELDRLDKEIDKLEKEVSKIAAKLSNASFVDKAPEEVVENEKRKELDLSSKLSNLIKQKEKIASL